MKNTFLDKLINRIDRVGQGELQTYLQRLNNEKGFFETIFNTLQEGIVVVDSQGRILYLNHAVQALLGIDPARAMGTPIAQYLKELDWPTILAEGRVVNRDLEVFYPQQRYLSFYLVPLEDKETSPMGFALIFHDLTAHRAQAREAIESEKLNAVTLLAAGVAHELGNPLNSLNIHLQLLERDLRQRQEPDANVSDEDLLESIRIARSEVNRLDTIINQFLGAVRPTQAVRSMVSINSIVRESLAFLQPEIKDRDVIVQEELGEALPPIPANVDQLKQAFYNLIKNAVQALNHGGILRVTTSRSDTHLQISFEDNGTGISVEDMAHITEPYFTRKKNGTGLGLFIVQRILHEHGGHLELLSEPGRGTTARILLPLAERRVRLLGAGDATPGAPASGDTPKKGGMTPVNDNLPTLLVVEDEKNTRDGLRRYFEGKFDIYLASDVATAMNVLESQPVDVLLTDLRLTGGTEGLDMLSRAQSIPHPPVSILMTAYGSEKVAVQAMKQGAYDYITKPLDLEKLDAVLVRALHSRSVETENRQLREELDKKFGLEKLIGNAPAMVEIYERIRQVAPTRATVLIEGESGTGKELVAQSLHMLSPRKSSRFVIVHCAALSPQLLESELFGHEKGAFTGASERRAGRFEEANHGTIFLDEIGEIDAATQVKLLRALGEQTIQRVGSNQNIKVDVRVIAATNKNLETMVREGKFRDDLFYRLDVVPIHLPPLRERREDIPLLINAFVQEFSRQNSKRITGLSADAQEALQRYDWPGNIRELRATIERAVVLCRGERIGLRDLPDRIQGKPEATDQTGGTSGVSSTNLNLEKMEKSFITQALRLTEGNVTEAAKLLGISRRTLHRKINTYQMDSKWNFIQSVLQTVEVGKGQFLVRIIPLLTAIFVIGVASDLSIYRGLDDAQSMDNAQLARQIVRGHGFTTEFLRPHAIAQLRDFAMSQSLRTGKPGDLFPPDQFPLGAPRVIPDTYNPPGYPCLLAAWFFIIHPEFDQTSLSMGATHIYSGDRWIPILNQIFLLLTAILLFALGRRLFDQRVAWMSMVSFLATDLVWRYSTTALSTLFLMFLVTAVLLCILEVFCVGEACHENDEVSFAPAWMWTLAASFLIGIACLTRLNFLVILVPIFLFLLLMPRTSFALVPVMAVVVAALVAPWFIHLNKVCGTPLGSNAPLMLYGEGDYKGNQIYCTTSIPNYERLFKDATKKETSGFRYNFEHAWTLLGANPLILLFGASILHQFKRRRTRLFHWLLFACAIALIAANNLGVAAPDELGPWNIVIIMFPCMLVMGCAFFFILLDRLNLQLWLLNNLIVTCTLVLTVLPLTLTLTAGSDSYYAFPPYLPPAIKSFGQYANPDEWVTSDMPWATAWYADRASLWLPDSISDFETLHDNVCPTEILLLTPVLWSQPISSVTTGEYKDWVNFIVGVPPPTGFPLSVHSMTPPGGPDYGLWSDRPRWQQH